jgi:hypothetical protein
MRGIKSYRTQNKHDVILRWPPQAALEGWPQAPRLLPSFEARSARASG